jgi:hypothetical protein
VNDTSRAVYMTKFSARLERTFYIIGWLLLVLGCSGAPSDQPELGLVTGRVTLDGTPLANVWVGFAPPDGRSSMGLTDKDGRYKLDYLFDTPGAKVGPHTVAITTPREDESGGEVPNFRELVPARYNTNTTLTADVKPGQNKIDFPLTTNAGSRK